MTRPRGPRGTRTGRSGALLALAFAAWLGCEGSAPPDDAAIPEPGRPRGVVLFVVDTLRADRLGLYGHALPTSPALDRIAAEAVVFDAAHAPAPWTLPSVVSLMTSTFPCEHRVLVDGQKLHPSLAPLAERLRDRGWATASFFSNAYAGPLSGLDRGFDVADLTREIGADTFAPWLARRGGDRPFFLYLHSVQPHDPYRASRASVALFGDVPQGRRPEVNRAMREYRLLTHADRDRGLPLGSIDNAAEQEAATRRLDALAREIDAFYDAEVRRADDALGEIAALLERRGLWDDVLFVFTSDHGEELGDHGAWQHNHSLYEEVVRVPLVIRFPGAAFGGQRIADPVTLVDLAPTLLDFLGVGAEGMRGESLMPRVRGEATADPERTRITSLRINRKVHHALLAARHGDVNVAFRRGRFKGIWNVDRATVELYDLAADAGERVDLARAGGGAEALGAARGTAESWLRACNARGVEVAPGGLEGASEETLEALRGLGYLR